ncbi:MAG TPA: cytochrome c oxidase subunit 3 [Flavobacterium sp.]|uniref:cytochrome c oxidase subunit 3 n=1 Tax=Flavobacterium sp. TaxID=239 RepID=UPI002C3CA6C8|nr:cytochrome c oxidase subunit 3 [Flavobacterium sp.]HSD14924.1 cytochrome c oxidase subunit 3 [Flavobacterium sp.]
MKTAKIDYKNIYYPPGGILIWIIIFLELLTFGMALIAFVYDGTKNHEIFHQSRMHLNTTLGLINTIFLLTSGFFMAKAVHEFECGNISKASLYMKLTALGGLLFIVLKSFEYSTKIDAGLTPETNTFYMYYWLLTVFHLIHVIVGIVIILWTNRSMKKANTTVETEDVKTCAAFWHMCDLIWLLLFPILYLIF